MHLTESPRKTPLDRPLPSISCEGQWERLKCWRSSFLWLALKTVKDLHMWKHQTQPTLKTSSFVTQGKKHLSGFHTLRATLVLWRELCLFYFWGKFRLSMEKYTCICIDTIYFYIILYYTYKVRYTYMCAFTQQQRSMGQKQIKCFIS
jgi:hypothetical protein